MKFKKLHLYQYAQFQGKNEKFFYDGGRENNMEGLTLELTSAGLVSIKTPRDHIYVWPTNIAYAVPFTDEPSKVSKSK